MSSYLKAMQIMHGDPEVLSSLPNKSKETLVTELFNTVEETDLDNTIRWAAIVSDMVPEEISEPSIVLRAAQSEQERRRLGVGL